MDGLALLLEQAGDPDEQNMFYNGWKHDHYVTNIFVFAPDGTVRAMVLNCPGSVHDSMVCEWGDVHTKLEDLWNRYGAKCCADSAFCSTLGPFIIKSSQDYSWCNSAYELLVAREAMTLK